MDTTVITNAITTFPLAGIASVDQLELRCRQLVLGKIVVALTRRVG